MGRGGYIDVGARFVIFCVGCIPIFLTTNRSHTPPPRPSVRSMSDEQGKLERRSHQSGGEEKETRRLHMETAARKRARHTRRDNASRSDKKAAKVAAHLRDGGRAVRVKARKWQWLLDL